jgi:tRNA 2-thiouridine synthesizing protein D
LISLKKKCLGILLLTSPYTYQNSHTFFDLAKAALEKGYCVKVFLFIDGVNNAILGQEPDPDRPMEERFKELAELGAEFQACGLCTAARGFDQEGSDFIAEVEVTGLTELAEIVGKCERFVTFTM